MGIFVFMWTTRNGEVTPICGSGAVRQLDGRKSLSNLIQDAKDCIKQSYYFNRDQSWVTHFSIGNLVSHDPDDLVAQCILPITKFNN